MLSASVCLIYGMPHAMIVKNDMFLISNETFDYAPRPVRHSVPGFIPQRGGSAMNMNMLKYFAAVAKTEQITKAAEQLNVTQPALSTSIHRLEDELGFQLFDRSGLKIKLNDYGKIFLETVTSMECAFKEGLEKMELLRQREVHFVRIGCSASSVNYQLINQLLSNDVHLTVDTIPANWEDELLSKNLDMVITTGLSQHPDIRRAILCHRRFEFVCSRDHPLATAKSLTTDDLSPYPFCAINDTRSALFVAKDIFDRVNFSPTITFLGRNGDDLITAIRSAKCLGLIAASRLGAADDLVILPVDNVHISLPNNLYWLRDDGKNSALNFARQAIIDFYRKLPLDW